jgi:hypothetical protein
MANRSKALPGYKRLPGHRYLTPRGKNISEVDYRNRKAKKSGYRNYYQQRRIRESRDFRKFRHDILTRHPKADLSPGGEAEKLISDLLAHREAVGGGERGSGNMIGEPGERFKALQEQLGLEPWMIWRFWYSEVSFG